jgi:tRNA threonylcarbamoyladenosine biosynthesis protein TsaB
VKNSHSEHITNIIKEFLKSAEITISDIDKCAVVVGPGSFTGLRIGIAFIKGFFATGETLVYPVTTLENMAIAYPLQNGIINIAIDARQENLFYAKFKRVNGELIRITDDKKVSKGEFFKDINSNEFTLYDYSGNRNETVFENLAKENSTNIDTLTLSTGISAAIFATKYGVADKFVEAISIFPNYMQESYAERMKKK